MIALYLINIIFKNNIFQQNDILNQKYGTKYQILVSSLKKDNKKIYDIYIYYKNKKYFVSKITINNVNYYKLFNIILSKTIDKWKEINEIDTSSTNKLECKVSINNIIELRHVRGLLKSNFLIQNLSLKSIGLNNNLYSISFVGSVDNFKESLEINRLSLFFHNNLCNIVLV